LAEDFFFGRHGVKFCPQKIKLNKIKSTALDHQKRMWSDSYIQRNFVEKKCAKVIARFQGFFFP
jgi:hypothetical protein